MQDKREIGYCVDRLEKTQYFKKEKGNKITFSTSEKLKSLKFRGSHNCLRGEDKGKRSSYKERKGNALALGADEGRG